PPSVGTVTGGPVDGTRIPPSLLSDGAPMRSSFTLFCSDRGDWNSEFEWSPEPRHHSLRPRQSLRRMSAAENDEVVSIRDDVCTERFPTSGQPAALQEPVHVDVGKHRARDPALRRAARVALATSDAPGPVAIIPFLDWRFQPQLDQPQHVPVHDAASY